MKPNVLQLIDSFNQGGTERQAVQLAQLLHEGGRYQVHVACLNAEGPLRKDVERIGLGDIEEFPLTSFYGRNMVTQLRRFARYLREREIDILHTHDFYTNVFGMTGAMFAKRSVVRIASRRETGGMRSGPQKFIQRRAMARAQAVVANAEAVRSELIAEGLKADKVKTIYNGLDLERLTPPANLDRKDALAQLGLQDLADRCIVTIVANMRHLAKDHRTFLRAAKRVHSEMPDAAFVLAGEGDLTDSLRMFASELGLARDSFFIGRCARMAELLFVSEVCVLSSLYEGFSNSLLEYMAAARAVVVTDVGGAREAVVNEETGFIVPPAEDEAMAMRITQLLRDPSRSKEMGLKGRRVVEEKFSCATQLSRTEEFYETLLAEKSARPVSRRREDLRTRRTTMSERR